MKTCLYAETLLDKVPKVLGCGMTNSYKYVGGACHTKQRWAKMWGWKLPFCPTNSELGRTSGSHRFSQVSQGPGAHVPLLPACALVDTLAKWLLHRGEPGVPASPLLHSGLTAWETCLGC